MNYSQFLYMIPEAALTAALVILFVADFCSAKDGKRSWFNPLASLLLALVTVVCCYTTTAGEASAFGGMYQANAGVTVVKTILALGTFIVVLMSKAWITRKESRVREGEFYMLTVSTLLGMFMMMSAGHYNELERLNKLRSLFFAEPKSLGQRTVPVERQSAESPENLRWKLGPVLFLSLNVPGPNNNFGMGRTAKPEYLERTPHVIDWIKQGFALARREESAGIVIVMQGNPAFQHFAAGLGHSGFRDLLDALRQETLGFPGQVLLIHGDTHWHRIDKPLRDRASGRRVENFTRLETFGYPIMGWAKVIIDTESPSLFRFESHSYTPAPIAEQR